MIDDTAAELKRLLPVAVANDDVNVPLSDEGPG